MIDPSTLKEFDRVVFLTDNRWTCERRLNEECECGRKHPGWIMRHKYRCEVWWDSDSIWTRCRMLERER